MYSFLISILPVECINVKPSAIRRSSVVRSFRFSASNNSCSRAKISRSALASLTKVWLQTFTDVKMIIKKVKRYFVIFSLQSESAQLFINYNAVDNTTIFECYQRLFVYFNANIKAIRFG